MTNLLKKLNTRILLRLKITNFSNNKIENVITYFRNKRYAILKNKKFDN